MDGRGQFYRYISIPYTLGATDQVPVDNRLLNGLSSMDLCFSRRLSFSAFFAFLGLA